MINFLLAHSDDSDSMMNMMIGKWTGFGYSMMIIWWLLGLLAVIVLVLLIIYLIKISLKNLKNQKSKGAD